MTLGSLFDGSGGFPLAGVLAGIKPVWSSEIEPYPLRVTAARFPDVKQLGSVTDIDGAKIEPVDIITFGSPCQDLSVAGKQLGIHEGQRSNLFFEAIRIIKEMRNADKANGRSGVDVRPRFAVWENVPGAFSSNGGDDFKAVLQALAGVCQDGLDISRPKKWNHAGGVAGDGWSIAWRVYDAQYWGVPQRRKRIYLVADFGSECADEILFKCESECRNTAARGTPWETTPGNVEGSAGRSDSVKCLNPWDCQSKRIFEVDGKYPTLAAYSSRWGMGDGIVYALQGNGIDRSDTAGCNGSGWRTDQMYTLNTVDRPAVCYDARGNGDGETVPTLTGDHENRITDYTAIWCQTVGSYMQFNKDVTNTLMARDYKDPQVVCWENDNQQRKYIVRRLTPLECCRLQGFPDWWEDGVDSSDSARYKMWGNGIALPCAYDVLNRIARFVE